MHGTRPDLAYVVIRLSQHSAAPQTHHWDDLKRVLRYLQVTPQARLTLRRHNDDGLTGYFDAAFSDSPDRRSTPGYLFLYHGSPISWASKLQRTIALSTIEAEFMAGSEACKELIWMRSVFRGLGLLDDTTPPTILRGDNTGPIALAKNPEFHQRTKHIELCCKWGLGLLKSRLCFLTSKKHKQDYKQRGTTTWGRGAITTVTSVAIILLRTSLAS